MAYARMGPDDSDIYLWPGPKGIHCTCCRLTEKHPESDWYTDVIVETPKEALEHLKEHQEAGHKVPQRAIDRLKNEMNS